MRVQLEEKEKFEMCDSKRHIADIVFAYLAPELAHT